MTPLSASSESDHRQSSVGRAQHDFIEKVESPALKSLSDPVDVPAKTQVYDENRIVPSSSAHVYVSRSNTLIDKNLAISMAAEVGGELGIVMADEAILCYDGDPPKPKAMMQWPLEENTLTGEAEFGGKLPASAPAADTDSDVPPLFKHGQIDEESLREISIVLLLLHISVPVVLGVGIGLCISKKTL